MDVMLQNKDQPEKAAEDHAIEIGKLLYEHKGGDVVVMDMRTLNFWTDFFIIATITSSTHLMGLERHIKDFAMEKELDILRFSRKPVKDGNNYNSDEWQLMELSGIVVHLMAAKTRSFFELERLWSAAPIIYRSESYSSKSS